MSYIDQGLSEQRGSLLDGLSKVDRYTHRCTTRPRRRTGRPDG